MNGLKENAQWALQVTSYAVELLFYLCITWPANALMWSRQLQADKNNTKRKLQIISFAGLILFCAGTGLPLSARLTTGYMNDDASHVWLVTLISYLLVSNAYSGLMDKIKDQFPGNHKNLSELHEYYRWLHSPFRRKGAIYNALGQPVFHGDLK